MVLPLLLIAAVAAGQAAQPTLAPQATASAPSVQRLGRPFMSPMGEPFRGRTPGEDGLIVWFEQADTNHDGALTVDEMTADAQRFFEFLDTNHDGTLDPDEITHYEGVIAPQLRVRSFVSVSDLPGGDQQVRYDDESSAGAFGLLQIPEPVASSDGNFDRDVSADEFRAAAARRFRLLDSNQSGRLTLGKLKDIRSAARGAVGRRSHEPAVGASDDPHSAEYGLPQH